MTLPFNASELKRVVTTEELIDSISEPQVFADICVFACNFARNLFNEFEDAQFSGTRTLYVRSQPLRGHPIERTVPDIDKQSRMSIQIRFSVR